MSKPPRTFKACLPTGQQSCDALLSSFTPVLSAMASSKKMTHHLLES